MYGQDFEGQQKPGFGMPDRDMHSPWQGDNRDRPVRKAFLLPISTFQMKQICERNRSMRGIMIGIMTVSVRLNIVEILSKFGKNSYLS